MTKKQALAAAKAATEYGTLTIHQGDRKHWAIRITGVSSEDAWDIGHRIQDALGLTDAVRINAGFAAVWVR